MQKNKEYQDLEAIFMSAVERVDPYKMIMNHVSVEDGTLRITVENATVDVDLDTFDKVFVLGAGKATARMAKAIEEILAGRITRGIISVKYEHVEPLEKVALIEAAHPVPDENSVRAAKEIENVARSADERMLVITLISGGGSALLTYPIEYRLDSETVRLTLHDKQLTTKALLECGATIEEVNCVRKHISNIKGGKLSRLIYPAVSINLILSDVVGDRLDTIASGLTTFDDTTFVDAYNVITKYEIETKLPTKVLQVIRYGMEGKIPETPKADDVVFTKVKNILIGTNYLGLLAASRRAEELGYNTVTVSSQIVGEAREVAKVFAAIARDVKRHDLLVQKPACLIAGGETTVTIRGDGKGGRNQELALSFLSELKGDPSTADGIYLLSAATDGSDGPTDAAGAFASKDVLESNEQSSLDINGYLKRNDSYRFFDALGYLLKTGPTNTNVCDLQIVIVK